MWCSAPTAPDDGVACRNRVVPGHFILYYADGTNSAWIGDRFTRPRRSADTVTQILLAGAMKGSITFVVNTRHPGDCFTVFDSLVMWHPTAPTSYLWRELH